MQKIVNINNRSNENKKFGLVLGLQEKRKHIPTKYLYDEYGSKLFEKICDTKEYYLTRLEKKILENNAEEILNISKPSDLFELGSGSSKKTKVLIKEKLKENKSFSYSSFDISTKALQMGYNEIRKISNILDINLYLGDFIFDLDKLRLLNISRLFLFLGSTLGNFKNDLAITFLKNLSKIMKKGDYLLLGVDMLKDENIILSAYNDSKGITKKFNKNILNVINEKYNLNFNLDNFEHQAVFNSEKSQIEMFLKSKKNHLIDLPNNKKIDIKNGEKILTEISRKFTANEIESILKLSNFKVNNTFQDKNKYYSLFLLEVN